MLYKFHQTLDIFVKPLYEHLKAVVDPRSPRVKKHELAKCKRDHWGVENRLHHVLDDAFREDRSPAKGSRNNLALIRKFALNLLRLVQIHFESPNTSFSKDRLRSS